MAPETPSFSVIVPSVGRPSLAGTLRSIAAQIRPGDEILVVCNDRKDLGTWARNSAIERARGTHLLFIDDDDEYVPGAFAAMRAFASQQPERIGIFREELVDGSLFWREPVFREGNVGSVLFVVPNVAGRIGRWVGSEGNDWRFIEQTAVLLGEPVFCDAVVARQRPNPTFSNSWNRLKFRLRLRTRLRRAGVTARWIDRSR